MKRLLFLLILTAPAMLSLVGCSWGHNSNYRYEQPTVAVFKFENRAPFPHKWELGDGMSDMLVSRLMATGRFRVLEREDIGSVLSEIDLQKSSYVRKEGRVEERRLKGVKYLIKGTITDFDHVAQGGIGIGWRWTRVGGGGKIALVAMVITVIDVESSEVLMAETVRGYTYCGGLDTLGLYQGVAFGGQMFFKMPLGHATNKAMKKATNRIVGTIGQAIWQPTILTVEPGRIIVNGGADRRVQPGTMYYVLRPSEPVYDSRTGDILGQPPGREVGVLMITDVFPKYAYAQLCEGSAGKEGYAMRALNTTERAALLDRMAQIAYPSLPDPAQLK